MAFKDVISEEEKLYRDGATCKVRLFLASLLHELSSSYSFGRVFFFAQDLVSHSATLNSDQSKQIVNACDYLIGVQWLDRLPALRAGVQ